MKWRWHPREPELPHRHRLGLSERAVQDSLRPHSGQVEVSLPRLPEAFMRVVEARLRERKWIELVEQRIKDGPHWREGR